MLFRVRWILLALALLLPLGAATAAGPAAGARRTLAFKNKNVDVFDFLSR